MRSFAVVSKSMLLPLACLLAALGLAACGSGDGPSSAVEEFAQAAIDGDAEKACSLVATDIVEQIEATDATCEEAIETSEDFGNPSDEEREQFENAEYETTEESDDAATVVVKVDGEDDSSVQLVNEDGDWKISEF